MIVNLICPILHILLYLYRNLKKISFGVYIWEKQKLEVQQFWL